MTVPVDTLLTELADLVAIPSVSADPERAADVRAAADWVSGMVDHAGGTCEVIDWHGQPLAIGEVRASRSSLDAPTVLAYGHFDVQPADPVELWDSDPFVLEERDGWLYGRGVADDKGQLYMLLKAAELLAHADALPVNVRFACDGEEETGGHSIVDWLVADERGADAAVIFDSDMLERGMPAFNVAVRGLVYFHVIARTGVRDLHSGIFGGAALNAVHALTLALSSLLARDGLLPGELRAGAVPPSADELAGWALLPPGAGELEAQGARPMDAGAGADFYTRTWAQPTLEINGIAGGSPDLQKTVLPVEARANVSIRLAPGQDADEIAAAFTRLLRDAAPPGTELEINRWSSAPAGLVDPASRALELGRDAFEAVVGRRPVLIRSGGTLPIVPALSARGIPVIVTGFALPDSNIHSPNERLLADYLPLGVEAARELLRRLADV